MDVIPVEFTFHGGEPIIAELSPSLEDQIKEALGTIQVEFRVNRSPGKLAIELLGTPDSAIVQQAHGAILKAWSRI